MTPERLEAVREHLETTGYSHAFKPQAFELLAEVDRLREGIERVRGHVYEAWLTQGDVGLIEDALDECDALLNPPTEGTDRE